ncbi:MAG: gamma-glutamylcyclotransferase family protein, partial [Pseudomonadota bacterium]
MALGSMFFFGTLRHVPLLSIVLGRPLNRLDVRDDALADYRVDAVAEGPFPLLRHDPGARAPGVVVSGLTGSDRARLDYYEAGFHYDVLPCTTVGGVDTHVYMADANTWTAAGPWDLDDWVAHWGAMTEFAAQEVMAGFRTVTSDEVARRFPRIRARAWSKVLAQGGRHGQGT